MKSSYRAKKIPPAHTSETHQVNSKEEGLMKKCPRAHDATLTHSPPIAIPHTLFSRFCVNSYSAFSPLIPAPPIRVNPLPCYILEPAFSAPRRRDMAVFRVFPDEAFSDAEQEQVRFPGNPFPEGFFCKRVRRWSGGYGGTSFREPFAETKSFRIFLSPARWRRGSISAWMKRSGQERSFRRW